ARRPPTPSRGPRPPPPPAPNRGPPGPPPDAGRSPYGRGPPAGRGGRGPPAPRGVALSTRVIRPSSDVPLSEEMAFSASSVVAISTKPKPLQRPVSPSVITAADIP